MGWVTWRQHRIALAGVVAFLSVVAAYVWRSGAQLHQAHAAATSCNLASAVCADLITRFYFLNHPLVGGYLLQPVPALIGAFVGAPVLARELETGTFRFAWTQSFSRWRWTLAKLVALSVVVFATAWAISQLFSWYYQPYFATGNGARLMNELSPLGLSLFDLQGIALGAWTVAAFAIGALAGMLIRRVVPAIVATLVAYTGLALVAGNLVRDRYLSALVTSRPNVAGSALVLSQWWTRGGRFAFPGLIPPEHLTLGLCSGLPAGPLRKPTPEGIVQCFAHHGYTLWTRYQPASRFWPFQLMEGGWVLALSAALIGVTVWLVRRRAA
jgi:hypothetical protein